MLKFTAPSETAIPNTPTSYPTNDGPNLTSSGTPDFQAANSPLARIDFCGPGGDRHRVHAGVN
jgi:hypothetical protein